MSQESPETHGTSRLLTVIALSIASCALVICVSLPNTMTPFTACTSCCCFSLRLRTFASQTPYK